jgi:hypothetical protein
MLDGHSADILVACVLAELELANIFCTFRGTKDLEAMVADVPDKQRKKILRAYAKWKLDMEEAQMVGVK